MHIINFSQLNDEEICKYTLLDSDNLVEKELANRIDAILEEENEVMKELGLSEFWEICETVTSLRERSDIFEDIETKMKDAVNKHVDGFIQDDPEEHIDALLDKIEELTEDLLKAEAG
jgi:hypothetical protein